MTTATIGAYAPNQGYIYGVQEHIDNIRYALGLARQATLEAAFAIHKAYTQLGQKKFANEVATELGMSKGTFSKYLSIARAKNVIKHKDSLPSSFSTLYQLSSLERTLIEIDPTTAEDEFTSLIWQGKLNTATECEEVRLIERELKGVPTKPVRNHHISFLSFPSFLIDNSTASKILGFNPVTKEKTTFIMKVTPEIAQYILDHHNFDNRILKKNQVKSIKKSYHKEGWIWDGDPIRFNTNGNITEWQHRLQAVVDEGITVQVVVVTGVEPESFTKGAEARKRTAGDEIQRKYPGALSSEITTLGEFVKRRGMESLNMGNAIRYWETYSVYVKEGNYLIDDFFDKVSEYSPYRRNFAAWASLMVMTDNTDLVSEFLDLLKDHILEDNQTTLTNDFYEFFKNQSWCMSNAGRATFMYQLLCVASDRFAKATDGSIQLGVTMQDFDESRLSRKGFYRKFLENPQGL